ncbi:hypothetical protein [Rhodococcus globerulus]|uniref:hypothetical protein n=1 Tax=Rhodococcus globerulus TaxID=33008 RepID=UPI001C568C1A|nr:hypothetical protein [Rhodococcus globerulus]QXW00779.1 hypothetical protein KYT97_20605 [Rhodococcus globerulus]
MPIVYSEKEAVAAVSTYLASTERRKKVRLRTYKTNVPGHLDFSTPRARGQIVHSDRSLTATDLRRIIERHSKNNAKKKSVVVITAGTFACDPQEFHLWPLLRIDTTGAVIPCNKGADKFNRIYQTQQNRAALFGLIPVAMLAIIVLALLSLAGVISGPTATVAITLGTIIFVVGAALAISGPLAGFAGLFHLFRGAGWLVDIPDKIDGLRRKRELARWQE